jgi:hypothetical protein
MAQSAGFVRGTGIDPAPHTARTAPQAGHGWPVGDADSPVDECQTVWVTDPSMTGRCLWGGVRSELTVPARAAGYGHCTRCQRRTATGASAQARVDGRTFRMERSSAPAYRAVRAQSEAVRR